MIAVKLEKNERKAVTSRITKIERACPLKVMSVVEMKNEEDERNVKRLRRAHHSDCKVSIACH